MENVLSTPFDAAVWDKDSMGHQANQIAEDLGLVSKDDIDSFRHAYVTAKLADTAEKYGAGSPESIVRIAGTINEVSWILGNNTSEESLADMGNNEWGLAIRAGVDREIEEMLKRGEITEKEKKDVREWLLRVRIAQAVMDGRLTQHPLSRSRHPSDRQKERDSEAEVRKRLDRYLQQRRKGAFYIWRTKEDDRVREDHGLRDGMVFAWDHPPKGGHPGDDYGCRCWAEPLEVKKK